MTTQFVITHDTARSLDQRRLDLEQQIKKLEEEHDLVCQQLKAIPLFLGGANGMATSPAPPAQIQSVETGAVPRPVTGSIHVESSAPMIVESSATSSSPSPDPVSLPTIVKRVLQEDGGRMSAIQIREAVIRAGIPRGKLGIGGSYLYTVLGRLDQRGHVDRHRGKYSLVPGVPIEDTGK